MNGTIFLSYIKKHKKGFLLFLLFSGILSETFYLYHLPVEAVLYGSLLCALVGLFFIIADYVNYIKRRHLLQRLQKYITVTMDDLPEAADGLEEDYQELLKILFDAKSKLTVQADLNSVELVDYYTMWAHQIKTPIAAMRLLLQSEQAGNNMKLLPELKAELFKIEQYVEMVLTYLRMESMSSDLLLMKYSLDDIVKQAVRKYSTLFIHKKILLDLSELNTQILTDEKWLVFVIEQILSNALKYTGQGGKIMIFMDQSEPNILCITDTGIGIEAEDLPRVFEKGFTGYNGRSDKKSTGIGLYLCKSILTKLSHTIQIESEVGTGTRVKINLDTIDMIVE